MLKNIAVIGSSGALGYAFINQLQSEYPSANISAFSRSHGNSSPKKTGNNIQYHELNYRNESEIEVAASVACEQSPLDLVIVATGMLHNKKIMPEKSLRDLSPENLQHLFTVNAIIPAMIAKYFIPTLNKNDRSFFAVLSARVGSISDNRLGGWYAYRASKAALNMVIKNAAIETERRNKKAIVVGLHPGTVDSELSKPFQKNVPDGKLFTPEYSAAKMINVLEHLTPEQSGKCFAWDGEEIEP